MTQVGPCAGVGDTAFNQVVRTQHSSQGALPLGSEKSKEGYDNLELHERSAQLPLEELLNFKHKFAWNFSI